MIHLNLPPKSPFLISGTCNPFSTQFEFDTIRLFLGIDILQEVNIDDLLLKISAKPFEGGYNGRYKGFSLTIRETGISIFGSFSNYFVGSTKILPFENFKKAVVQLEKELNLNLQEAKLNRVDVNWNVCTSNPVEAYNKFLFLDLTSFTRLEKSKGVNFESGSKGLIIYNKTAQLKAKKYKIDAIPSNWLRIEYRILNKVKKHLGISRLDDLFKPKNIIEILTQLRKYYFKIEKRTEPKYDLASVKTKQDYLNMLLRQMCELKGGVEAILEEIEYLDKRKVFTSRNQKCRFRKSIKDLLRSKNVTSLHPLVDELNNQFDLDFKKEVLRIKELKM